VTPIHTSRASTPSTTADEPDVVDPVDESVLRASSRARRRARARRHRRRGGARNPFGHRPERRTEDEDEDEDADAGG
jgi:hypothetical protein